jgi:hypothetical protein
MLQRKGLNMIGAIVGALIGIAIMAIIVGLFKMTSSFWMPLIGMVSSQTTSIVATAQNMTP